MAHNAHDCPFLNRADERCSKHFHVDHLEHAFHHCFDRYHACSIYAERLEERVIERRFTRQVDVLREYVGSAVDSDKCLHADPSERHARPAEGRPLVQISISRRFANAFRRTETAAQPVVDPQLLSAGQGVSALSGV